MLAVPAAIAGCAEIVLCTPAGRDGSIAPEIRYAAALCGVRRVFALGGAQAVAAMAYGTESVPRVDKIFGPGNRYVTRAKQLVGAEGTAIDLPAGPSEVLVLADEGASPDFAAADLLSQAEHGGDSQAVLVCRSVAFARRVNDALRRQTAASPRNAILRESLAQSRIVVFDSQDDMLDFAEAYAPEHLIVSLRDPWPAARRITTAGAGKVQKDIPDGDECKLVFGDGALLTMWQVDIPEKNAANPTGTFIRYADADGRIYQYDTDQLLFTEITAILALP